MTAGLHSADRAAFERMLETSPVWDGIDTAANAFDLDANVLLHAGPPFESPATISKPILNSACVAAVFEGLASDFEQAEAMIRAGEIELRPAQDHCSVTPLAAVVSASMPLHRVTDSVDSSLQAYAPLNGGMRAPMRLGLRSEAVLDHIRWLNGPWAELLAGGLSRHIEVIPIAAEALRQGDDCHGRTPAGTKILMAQFEKGLADASIDDNTRDFMDNSPPLFLNLWMAASKCLMLRAAGVHGSSLVIAAAGNGVDAGIQVSGLPGRWFQAPATPPQGRFDVDLPAGRALPAIGDSAVVEGLGLGAMALQFSPEQEKNLGDFLPSDYLERAGKLMCGRHPGFGELDCRLGLCARAAAECGRGPIIGLGILDLEGDKGRLGGGVYDMPPTVFEQAVTALSAQIPP
jgi:hypothetical protein